MSAEFLQQIPWLSAALLADVALKTAVLLQGRWRPAMRWLELATLSFGLYVAYRIFSLEQISTVSIFNTMAKAILAIIILVELLEIAGKLFSLLWGRPFAPRALIKSKLA